MEATRAAAGRLAARGQLNVLQKGQIVDLETVKGPIRLQLAGDAQVATSQSKRPLLQKGGVIDS